MTKRRREARPTNRPTSSERAGNADDSEACECEGGDDAFRDTVGDETQRLAETQQKTRETQSRATAYEDDDRNDTR